MKKSVFSLLIILLFTSLLSGCFSKSEMLTTNEEVNIHQKANEAYVNYTSVERANNLKALAPMIAKVINQNPAIKHGLGQEIGKKFDGDFDVLYDFIANKRFNTDKTFEEHLRGLDQAVSHLTDTIPYLNIAIPVNYDQWDSYNETVYVIPMRYDIADTEIEFLYGYDGFGHKKPFYANQEPDVPVVVIGINERVTSNLTSGTPTTDAEIAVMNGDGTQMHDEMLNSVKLLDDKEPWYSGAAEVYSFWVAGYYDIYNKVDLTSVNYSGTTYDISRVVMQFANTYPHEKYEVEFWEQDTGTRVNHIVAGQFNSTWNQGVTYYNKAEFFQAWGAEDDRLGKYQIRFDHYNPDDFTFENCVIFMGYKTY